MNKPITHIDKSDLPNPFSQPVQRQPQPAQRPQPTQQREWGLPELKTITIRATTIKPGTPPDRQPMTMESPMVQAKPADQPVQRQHSDRQDAVDFFGDLGGAVAVMIGQFIDGLVTGSDMFGAFLAGFGSSFSLNTQRPKRKIPMKLAYYSIYHKLADPITRVLEKEIYQVTPIAYQDDQFIFAVPIKMYKICEKILDKTGITYERVEQ